jgi:hypothetical protein
MLNRLADRFKGATAATKILVEATKGMRPEFCTR